MATNTSTAQSNVTHVPSTDESGSAGSSSSAPSRNDGKGSAIRRNKQLRLQRFVFTLPNYTEEELSWFKNPQDWPRVPKWLICGREVCPSTSTPHLQGIEVYSVVLTLMASCFF